MKKIVFLAALFATGLSYSMTAIITLPSADVLKKRLEDQGFQDFVQKTKLVKELGDNKTIVERVALLIELSLDNYDSYIENPLTQLAFATRKHELCKLILQENPQALQEIKDLGLLR